MALQSQTAELTERRNPSVWRGENQFHSFLPFETNMKSALQLIVLLACIFLYTSGNPITRCRCIKIFETLRRPLIADVNVYEPNPLCKEREVIVIMKDDNQRCLDPKSNFTKRLLRDKEMQKTAAPKKLSTTTTTTTKTTTTTTAATTKSAAK